MIPVGGSLPFGPGLTNDFAQLDVCSRDLLPLRRHGLYPRTFDLVWIFAIVLI